MKFSVDNWNNFIVVIQTKKLMRREERWDGGRKPVRPYANFFIPRTSDYRLQTTHYTL